MGFDEEWAQARAAAAEQAESTRLNALDAGPGAGEPSLAPGPGGAGGPGASDGPAASEDLAVRQDDLGAVGNEAHRLFERFSADGDVARESSHSAAATLKSNGFTLGSALSLTAEVWDSQRRTLLQACAHISDHLDHTRKRHREDEAHIAATMRQRDGSPMPASRILDQFT
ncbi:hypothetical protein [Streptomyces sparsus]